MTKPHYETLELRVPEPSFAVLSRRDGYHFSSWNKEWAARRDAEKWARRGEEVAVVRWGASPADNELLATYVPSRLSRLLHRLGLR